MTLFTELEFKVGSSFRNARALCDLAVSVSSILRTATCRFVNEKTYTRMFIEMLFAANKN